MAYEALAHYSDRALTVRFVSNVEATDVAEATRDLDPAETLFIVCSKTFTTLETLTNAQTARAWLLRSARRRHGGGPPLRGGLDERRRRSRSSESTPPTCSSSGTGSAAATRCASAIGLSLMVAIGPERFREMLAGYHAMDEHFRSAPFDENLPVLLGLIGLWYVNFFGAETQAVLPYDHYLGRLPPICSSSTWRATASAWTGTGAWSNYQTGPVVWGQPGTNGQHAYYQLIHQGTQLIPCDFIGFCQTLNPLGQHHDLLLANLFAQTEALAFGKTAEEVEAEGAPPALVPHRTFPGNRPTNTILVEQLTPEMFGELDRALRAQGLRPGHDLAHQLVRPVGRRAGQGAGQADHAGAARGRLGSARARQLDQHLDPAVSIAAAGVVGRLYSARW